MKLGSLPELPDELLAFATGTVRDEAARRLATGIGGGGTSAMLPRVLALAFAATQACLLLLSEPSAVVYAPLLDLPL